MIPYLQCIPLVTGASLGNPIRGAELNGDLSKHSTNRTPILSELRFSWLVYCAHLLIDNIVDDYTQTRTGKEVSSCAADSLAGIDHVHLSISSFKGLPFRISRR